MGCKNLDAQKHRERFVIFEEQPGEQRGNQLKCCSDLSTLQEGILSSQKLKIASWC